MPRNPRVTSGLYSRMSWTVRKPSHVKKYEWPWYVTSRLLLIGRLASAPRAVWVVNMQ